MNKSILALAVPAIVANITTPLLSLVDIAIVGHLGSAAFVGAIAVGGSMFNMLYWLFGFLRFGTSGLTAQAVGRRDSAARRLTGLRSVAIGAACGLLLILLSRPTASIALTIMDPDPATRQLADLY
ncbi:MAG: MATE family efflux transporter, partial [Muribaculaceae bacterium]|nr:MATE family efflux transporter [Muribaculaceae bacterium]